MLAFCIRYLNGFVAAAEPDNLERAEWPPHPGRVFMALAAAHFQIGAEPAEREALLWLDGSMRDGEISAPQILASEALSRRTVTCFVPVNDVPIWKKDPAKPKQKPPPPLQSCPGIMRVRNARTFARAWLADETVSLVWPDLDPPEPHRRALEQLCGKVTRIGHSSSLVQMWLAGEDELTEPNWLPDDDRAGLRLRIAGPGTLEYLEQEYNAMAAEDYANLKVQSETTDDAKTRKAAKQKLKQQYDNRPPPQRRPQLALYQGYARPESGSEVPAGPGTVFDPYVITLRLERRDSAYRALELGSTLAVTTRWREAIISHSNDESDRIRALLSGHDPGGKPLKDPHLAFLPLAFVGHEHADGHLLGMGLALPADITRDERRAALRVIAQVKQLKLGPLGVWNVTAVTESSPPHSLRPGIWTAHPEGATHWSTVTPVAFDRHAKAKNKVDHQRELAGMVAKSCERIGLPKPREVIVTPVSAHLGTPPAHAFPKLKRKDGSDRRHSHVILVFDEAVGGPILVGAGRFRGYGLFRPMNSK